MIETSVQNPLKDLNLTSLSCWLDNLPLNEYDSTSNFMGSAQMATDYKADVAKYTANVNEAAIATIVKYCGIALRNKDSSLVSSTDPAELERVRVGFATKKLALTDAQWASGSKTVIEKMKADKTKERVTFYYLLAEATGTMEKLA